MSEKVQAEFLLTTFEYRTIFVDPIFSAFEKPTAIGDVLYHALREWGPTFDNISFRSIPSTANDLQVTCDLLNKRVTFAVHVYGCVVTMTNPNWSEAQLIRNLIEKGVGAVEGITGAVVKIRTAALAVHIKGQGKSRQERINRFRPAVADLLPVKNESGFGFCVYGEDISWLIDLSQVYPDALFVRIIRMFDASISNEEVSSTLYKDEEKLLDLLELSIL